MLDVPPPINNDSYPILREEVEAAVKSLKKDNIKEWTGLQWNIALQKAENREEWRKLVVKSTVVPQWSARLRDR